MSKLVFRMLVILAVATGFASTAHAGLIEVSIEGTIDRVVSGDRSVGENIVGTIIYDSESPLTSGPFGSGISNLNFNGAISSFVLAGQEIDLVTFNILSRTYRFFEPGPIIRVNHTIGFHHAGFDQTTDLYESLNLDLRGIDLFEDPFSLSDSIDFADVLTGTFGYSREQSSGPGQFMGERFYGIVNSLSVRAVSIPSASTIWLVGPLLIFLMLHGKGRSKASFSAVATSYN
jgi:hypothetical protein